MKKRRKKSYCFNCNNALSREDNFCRKCGQENHDKKASLKSLVNDFLGDYFTFDSKIWRSLKLLCFSPGQLTLHYSEGKVTDYVRPIRLALFLSLVYVVSFSMFLDNTAPLIPNDGVMLNDELSAEERYVEVIKNYSSIDEYLEEEKPKESALNVLLQKGVLNIVGGNKNIFNETLKKSANLLLFLFPVLGLVLMASFWRNKMYYVEHFVHALHINAFFFLTFSIGVFISWAFSISMVVIPLVFVLLFIYSVLSYKRFYNRSYGVTIYKVLINSAVYLSILSIGFLVSLIITISMY